MSLKNRLVNNGIASILQKGVRVLDQLLLVPFFITSWGAAYYGEWLTLTIIPEVIGFSDFGIGTAAANSFILSYASGDKKKAADINKCGLLLISVMIIFGMLLSSIVLFLLDSFEVFESTLINKNEAIWAVVILIFARLLKFYMQLIQAYYRSAQRAALSMNLQSLYSFINLAAGFIVLTTGYGVIEYASSQLLVVVIFIFYYYWKGKTILQISQNFKGVINKSILKYITKKGISYLMSPIWQSLYFQGSTFIVRLVIGPEAVAIFNTVRTLSRSLNQFFYMIKSTVYPELQFEIGMDNWTSAQRLFRISIYLVFSLSLVGSLLLAFFGLWFYEIWTNNQLNVPEILWYLFVLSMLFNAIWWTTEMIYGAVNQPKRIAICGIIGSFFSLGITYIGSNRYGLNGAAFGALALDIFMLILVVPHGLKLIRLSLKDFLNYFSEDMHLFLRIISNKLKVYIK